MIGAGKYDKLCTHVRMKAKAMAAIVLIIGGKKGSGFSVQAPPDVTEKVPAFLRELADQIEADIKADLEKLQ